MGLCTGDGPRSHRRLREGSSFEGAPVDHELWTAVQRVPRRQQQVVFLRYVADLKERETAGVLQVSEGSVSASLRLAVDVDRGAPTPEGARDSLRLTLPAIRAGLDAGGTWRTASRTANEVVYVLEVEGRVVAIVPLVGPGGWTYGPITIC